MSIPANSYANVQEGLRIDRAAAHDREALLANAAEIKRRREVWRRRQRANREKEERDAFLGRAYELDGLAEEVSTAPPGSEERIAALADYYASDEARAEISPFEIEAGDILMGLLTLPDYVCYETDNGNETHLREIIHRHPSKQRAVSLIRALAGAGS